ncbi:TcpE family conjugal transfer membrane protein [Desmospora activa]|uniref:TcpE family protein n=1 Tax=Desmospora activa DSM 45169 TaxID=1121389 RepID=A0A2T4YZ10_9BACL|nr:TcpE family conjugal transfer membrane protein [Desmospora activa]PTM52183.1 TcpE family protein [Desmospora activa DSM 45169]
MYDSVFKIDKTVYSIQGVRLLFPVSYRQAGFFVGTLAVMLILNAIPATRWALDATWVLDSYLAKFIGVPALVAWYFTKKTLDGKAPHRFLWRWLEYRFSPRRYRRYQEMERPSKGKWQYEGVIGYRNNGGEA